MVRPYKFSGLSFLSVNRGPRYPTVLTSRASKAWPSSPNPLTPNRNSMSGLQPDQWGCSGMGPYQVEGLVGVLESQEHVLEDRQSRSPDNGVQKLGKHLKENPWSGVPQAWPTQGRVQPPARADAADPGLSKNRSAQRPGWTDRW